MSNQMTEIVQELRASGDPIEAKWANEIEHLQTELRKANGRMNLLEQQRDDAAATLFKLNSGAELQDLMKLNNDLQKQLVKSKRIEDAARHYFNHYLLDEADDSEWCLDMEHFHAVRALQDALTDDLHGKQK